MQGDHSSALFFTFDIKLCRLSVKQFQAPVDVLKTDKRAFGRSRKFFGRMLHVVQNFCKTFRGHTFSVVREFDIKKVIRKTYGKKNIQRSTRLINAGWNFPKAVAVRI